MKVNIETTFAKKPARLSGPGGYCSKYWCIERMYIDKPPKRNANGAGRIDRKF